MRRQRLGLSLEKDPALDNCEAAAGETSGRLVARIMAATEECCKRKGAIKCAKCFLDSK